MADEVRHIAFGLDMNGFFPVLMQGERAVCRLRSELSCDTAMWHGMAWADQERIAVDVIRVDVRLLDGKAMESYDTR